MVMKLFRAFALQHSGVDCRSCGAAVHRKDAFGLSEGVCGPCR